MERGGSQERAEELARLQRELDEQLERLSSNLADTLSSHSEELNQELGRGAR